MSHTPPPVDPARRPYTITKQREAWSDEEHQKFLEALRLYKREWKQIEAYVGTKTVIQIRSHAQKYFLKVQKLGTGEHVPPPRPKRKSSQPYPQAVKVPKAKAKATPRARGGAAGATGGKKKATAAGGAAVCRAGVGAGKQRNRGAGDSGSAALQTAQVHAATKAAAQAAVAQAAAQHQAAAQQAVARPDFASVYSLVSTLFGPCCSLGDTSSPDAQMPMPGAPAAGAAADSAGMLRNMTPIDRETALMLLSNLSSNLEKRAVHTQQLGKLTELGRQLAEPEGGGDLDARGGPYLTRFSDHEIVSMAAFPAVPVHLPLPGLQVPLVAVDGQTLPSAAAAV